MAVTAIRSHSGFTSSFFMEFVTLTFASTYVTGGVPFNPVAVPGAKGASPLPGSTVLGFQAFSQAAYDYYLIGTGTSAVLKIYTPAGAELANGSAFPEATLNALLYLRKLG